MTITYNPVAGLTIKEALERAVEMADKKRQCVLVVINDIVMAVNKNTNIDEALKEYHDKLDFKYQIAKMKRTNEDKGSYNMKQAIAEYKKRLALRFVVLNHKGTKYDR